MTEPIATTPPVVSAPPSAPSRKLWLAIFILGVLGIGLFIVILLRNNLRGAAGAIAAAGWGVAAVVAFHAVVLLTNVLAWRSLFPHERRLPILTLFWIRWIGESVQNLMPATAVGGEIVRTRVVALRGVPVATSAATVIVDITLGIFGQIIFTLSGIYLLARATGRAGITMQAIGGSAIAIAAVVGFYAVQRYGIFRIVRALVGKIINIDAFSSMSQHGQALDEEVAAVYSRRADVWTSFFWSLLNWASGAGEVWIALWAMGVHEHVLLRGWILESLQQGVRAVVFLIPGGLGFQEGGYVVVGTLLGLRPDISLALALIRRLREVSFGVPGVLTWQAVEGRHLLRRRAAESGQ